MQTKCFVIACLGLSLLFNSSAFGQDQKKFDPYWKKVAAYKIPAQRVSEYRDVLEKVKGLALRKQTLVPMKGYSLFENNNSLLVTPGNENTTEISHSSVTKIPGLGERIKWIFSDGSMLAYYCTCGGEGGDCKIMELNCVNAGCGDCGSYWVIGVPGNPPIIITQDR